MPRIAKSAEEDVTDTKTPLEIDIERAKAIQASLRKHAPQNIRVGSMWVDPRETYARRLVPDAFWSGTPSKHNRRGSVPPTMTAAYYASGEHKQRVAEGWEPVIDDGEHAGRDGDLLYKRPIEMSKDVIKQASEMSKFRLENTDEDARAAGLIGDKSEVTVTDKL